MLLLTLLTQSAAFGWHARSLPVRHRVPPPVACANEGLIGTMCAFETDDERQAAMKAVFAEWPAGSHDSKGDDVVADISKRIGKTQTAALAAHGRGEDTVGKLCRKVPYWHARRLPLGAGTGTWLALHSLEEHTAQSPTRGRSANFGLDKSRGS